MGTLRITFICLCFVWLSSCGLFDEDERYPSYIHIAEYHVEVSENQGAAAQDISDIWVYQNSDLRGAYPLGVDVPLLDIEDSQLLLFPGIRENGIRSLPSIHFMLRPDTFYLNTPELSVDTLVPTFRYFDDVVFRWVETFDFTNTLSRNEDGNPNTVVQRTNEESFAGNFSGRMRVDRENPLIEAATEFVYLDMPVGRPVYLEMHYKNDHEFAVGLIGERFGELNDKVYKLFLNPTDEWKKVVVNFQDEITFSDFDGYRILFGLFLSSDHPSDTATVYLDNLKLLHR